MATGIYKPLRVRMPILPRSTTDPTLMGKSVRDAEKDFGNRFDAILKRVLTLVSQINVKSVLVVNARVYTYEIDELMLASLYGQIDWIVEAELMQRLGNNHWFFERYQGPAYRAGAVAAYLNISHQSDVYAAAIPSVQDYLISDAYRRRSSLVRARQFELMKGIVGEVKSDLARVLGDGIDNGLNPREISRNITAQIGIEKRRANRIAQTEITGALRRAKWDENEQAAEAYNVQMMELHISALKPTTRIGHAQRHGKLYTTQQVREWYSEGANAINCYCSQTSVMVDSSGNVVSPAMQRRLEQMAVTRVELIEDLEIEKNA